MELKDYLHLYLGCDCEVSDRQVPDLKYFGKLTSVNIYGGFVVETKTGYTEAQRIHFSLNEDNIKPILRRLSSMTEEEREQLNDIELGESSWPTVAYALAPCFKWMLSKGFDLFCLIDAGLAIDKETIKT